jgi:2-polyprenyl-3-methyl-5-hydroxy-6-metoxy-1,4-benzoquinol methylase
MAKYKSPDTPQGKAGCPVCGQLGGEPLETSHKSHLYACSRCDLHFWYPVTMPGADWYEATYKGRDTKPMPLEPGHRSFLDDVRAPKKGRLLDMGCGNGNFLAAARDRGFEVTGIEPDQHAVQFAKEHYQLKHVFAQRPEDFRRTNSGTEFDVVTFFEVLEHQEDPRAFLEIANSFLKTEGRIALSVPNRDRWQVGMDTLDYPPNHLTRWSPRALQNFLERNCFEILSIQPQRLTVSRTAQMLSAFFKTGMVSRLAGEKPLVLADLSDMPIDEIHQKIDRQASDRRQRLASHLATWKARLMIPLAFLLLPFLRLRGYKGLYLYCMVRRKRSPSEPAHQPPGERHVRA